MIGRRTVLEIVQLKEQGFSIRSISRQLQIDRATVSKYLVEGNPVKVKRAAKRSKLDPYREMIATMVAECGDIKAPVVLQRIKAKGFTGKSTIVRDLLRQLRGERLQRLPFIRFETEPGEQIQIDWGHFPPLTYGEDRRKLYALAVVEGYSRMLYVYFSHSQKQAYLQQGLLEAFAYFNGVSREIVVDNMLTAVTERVGTVIRFNETFLDFLSKFGIHPCACTIRSPHEKGKVENAIKYLRQNFWPLRKNSTLYDVQEQVRQWLDNVANVRKHATTGQRPVDRRQGLSPLPDLLPDCRETTSLKVHKDFGVRFDANVYTVPPWAIGKQVTVKADNRLVSIYLKEKRIACHQRCWQRQHRLELPHHREQVKKIRKRLLQDRQVIVFLSMGEVALHYLNRLSEQRLSIKKNIPDLLRLRDEFGDSSLIYGLQKSLEKNVVGADYVRNILYQEMTPITSHLPVQLKQQELNTIRLTTPALAEYDAIAIKRRRENG